MFSIRKAFKTTRLMAKSMNLILLDLSKDRVVGYRQKASWLVVSKKGAYSSKAKLATL
jgi:hypothetical protein